MTKIEKVTLKPHYTTSYTMGTRFEATVSPADATVEYVWARIKKNDPNGDWSNSNLTKEIIEGATGSTYIANRPDVGCRVAVAVRGVGEFEGTANAIADVVQKARLILARFNSSMLMQGEYTPGGRSNPYGDIERPAFMVGLVNTLATMSPLVVTFIDANGIERTGTVQAEVILAIANYKVIAPFYVKQSDYFISEESGKRLLRDEAVFEGIEHWTGRSERWLIAPLSFGKYLTAFVDSDSCPEFHTYFNQLEQLVPVAPLEIHGSIYGRVVPYVRSQTLFDDDGTQTGEELSLSTLDAFETSPDNYTIQWQYKSDVYAEFTDIEGATGETYTPEQEGEYRVVLTAKESSWLEGSAESASYHFTVQKPPLESVQLASGGYNCNVNSDGTPKTIALKNNEGYLNIEAIVTPSEADCTFSWEVSREANLTATKVESVAVLDDGYTVIEDVNTSRLRATDLTNVTDLAGKVIRAVVQDRKSENKVTTPGYFISVVPKERGIYIYKKDFFDNETVARIDKTTSIQGEFYPTASPYYCLGCLVRYDTLTNNNNEVPLGWKDTQVEIRKVVYDKYGTPTSLKTSETVDVSQLKGFFYYKDKDDFASLVFCPFYLNGCVVTIKTALPAYLRGNSSASESTLVNIGSIYVPRPKLGVNDFNPLLDVYAPGLTLHAIARMREYETGQFQGPYPTENYISEDYLLDFECQQAIFGEEFTVKWYRVTEAGTRTLIHNADGQDYTLTLDDIGYKIQAEYTASPNGKYDNSLDGTVLAETLIVKSTATDFTGELTDTVTIPNKFGKIVYSAYGTGHVVEQDCTEVHCAVWSNGDKIYTKGEVLVPEDKSKEPYLTFQWYRISDYAYSYSTKPETQIKRGEKIKGATSSSYRVTADDLGYHIGVVVGGKLTNGDEFEDQENIVYSGLAYGVSKEVVEYSEAKFVKYGKKIKFNLARNIIDDSEDDTEPEEKPTFGNTFGEVFDEEDEEKNEPSEEENEPSESGKLFTVEFVDPEAVVGRPFRFRLTPPEARATWGWTVDEEYQEGIDTSFYIPTIDDVGKGIGLYISGIGEWNDWFQNQYQLGPVVVQATSDVPTTPSSPDSESVIIHCPSDRYVGEVIRFQVSGPYQFFEQGYTTTWMLDGVPVPSLNDKSIYVPKADDAGKTLTIVITGKGSYSSVRAEREVKITSRLAKLEIPTGATNKATTYNSLGVTILAQLNYWTDTETGEILSQSNEFTPSQDLVGKTIAYNGFYADTTRRTAFVKVVEDGEKDDSPKFTISLPTNIKAGETAKVVVTPNDATVTYRWKLNGVLAKSNITDSYKTQESEAGKKLQVTVIGTGDYENYSQAASCDIYKNETNSPTEDNNPYLLKTAHLVGSDYITINPINTCAHDGKDCYIAGFDWRGALLTSLAYSYTDREEGEVIPLQYPDREYWHYLVVDGYAKAEVRDDACIITVKKYKAGSNITITEETDEDGETYLFVNADPAPRIQSVSEKITVSFSDQPQPSGHYDIDFVGEIEGGRFIDVQDFGNKWGVVNTMNLHGGSNVQIEPMEDGYLISANVSDGPAGPAGPQGPEGPQGPMGPQGPQGPTGPQGPVGPQGPAGEDGADGANGRDGQDGRDGTPGPVGPQGPKGDKGEDGQDGQSVYVDGNPIHTISGEDGIDIVPEETEDGVKAVFKWNPERTTPIKKKVVTSASITEVDEGGIEIRYVSGVNCVDGQMIAEYTTLRLGLNITEEELWVLPTDEDLAKAPLVQGENDANNNN